MSCVYTQAPTYLSRMCVHTNLTVITNAYFWRSFLSRLARCWPDSFFSQVSWPDDEWMFEHIRQTVRNSEESKIIKDLSNAYHSTYQCMLEHTNMYQCLSMNQITCSNILHRNTLNATRLIYQTKPIRSNTPALTLKSSQLFFSIRLPASIITRQHKIVLKRYQGIYVS